MWLSGVRKNRSENKNSRKELKKKKKKKMKWNEINKKTLFHSSKSGLFLCQVNGRFTFWRLGLACNHSNGVCLSLDTHNNNNNNKALHSASQSNPVSQQLAFTERSIFTSSIQTQVQTPAQYRITRSCQTVHHKLLATFSPNLLRNTAINPLNNTRMNNP